MSTQEEVNRSIPVWDPEIEYNFIPKNLKDAEDYMCDICRYILIPTWFDKEWFETTFDVSLTDDDYIRIVELWNNSIIEHGIEQIIVDWVEGSPEVLELLGDRGESNSGGDE